MINLTEEQLTLLPAVETAKTSKVLAVSPKSVCIDDGAGGMIVVDTDVSLVGKLSTGTVLSFNTLGVGSVVTPPKAKAAPTGARQGCAMKRAHD